MAERRMFAKTIIDSDVFLDMPHSTQLLYFHLSMRSDDDGFINNPKNIMRMIGCKDDDLKLLLAKKFLIYFDSGVVVIKHWKIHNYIQKDRYRETKYKEEKDMLELDENNAYTMKNEQNPTCIQNVYMLDTQDRDRIEIELGNINKKKKKENQTELDKVLDEKVTDEDLKSALRDFIKMRKTIKKPITTRGLELAIDKLNKLSNKKEEQILIIDKTILRSWQSFFPLNDEDKKELEQPKEYKASTMTEEEYHRRGGSPIYD